jgi:cysteine sulfinate desulfinase/cysteine desulfurase-like protein
MSHLLLSHLSKNNNCPKLVHKLFNKHANGVKMIIASRYEETAVYNICNSLKEEPIKAPYLSSQLSLAFA